MVDEQHKWAVYLDVCCLNRPFDDQSQDRIRLESEPIILIIDHCQRDDWLWLCSGAALHEIEQTPARARRERVLQLALSGNVQVRLQAKDYERGTELQKLGFTTYDALHIACAERGQADVMLTTDARLVKRAKRVAESLKVRVENPLTWLQEVLP